MKLSIVTTLYMSAPHIDEFLTRATASATLLVGEDFEVVLVNDGSPDQSLTQAVEWSKKDQRITVIDLSRNFGHHKAIMTGLGHAQGDLVFLIDSDLEEDPELLGSFATQLTDDGCDVVYGVQHTRKGGWFERFSGRLTFGLLGVLGGVQIPANVSTVRLMTRRYVEALVSHREREVIMAGIWAITGFDQRPQVFNKHSTSKSTYTFGHKLALLSNAITGFTNAPLKAIFYCGVLIMTLALAYVAAIVVTWVFGSPPSGWSSVMASVWLLGGIMISFIGVIGIYLSKIFTEVKQRPYTIIREVYRGADRSAR